MCHKETSMSSSKWACGIGETALAQVAYSYPSVHAHCGKGIWVSKPFDQCRVANTIIEVFDGDHPTLLNFQI